MENVCNVVRSIAAVQDFLSALPSSDVSVAIFDAIRKGDHRLAFAIAGDVNLSSYDDLLPSVYAAKETISKFPFWDLGIDRAAVAFESFKQTEIAIGNQKPIGRLLKGLSITDPLHSVFHLAKLKIERILGHFSWDEVYSHTSFGPGASLDVPRRRSERANKYGCLQPSVTQGCLDLAEAALRSFRLWDSFHNLDGKLGSGRRFTVVQGNKVVTVPKSSKTDRVIAIEPTMNMYIQRGIGSVIRSRLLRASCDLSSQLLNQKLALEGSLDASLATIDLASASDSISLSTCEFLLPAPWMEALELTRSPFGTLPSGEKILYRKVSSMGNGFTFDLETLLFLGIVRAVMDFIGGSDKRHAVYGDDIVVPADCSDLVIRALSVAGFKTNTNKSFVSEFAFRESCGKHYFRGRDVTPFYFRDKVDTPDRTMWFVNHLRAYAYRQVGLGYGCDARYRHVWEKHFNTLPKRYKACLGPLHVNGEVSSDFVGVPLDVAVPHRARHQLDGYECLAFHRKYSRRSCNGLGSLLYWIDSRRDRDYRVTDNVSLGEVPTSSWRPAFSRRLVTQYQDCGPWVDWS